MTEPTVITTPKRKRGEGSTGSSPIFNAGKFIFDFGQASASADDGNSSPRSKVAHSFRGLALESGGGVAEHSRSPPAYATDATMQDVDDEYVVMRKRTKFPGIPMQDADAVASAGAVGVRTGPVIVPEPDPAIVKKAGHRRTSATGPKSPRPKKRAGTPPLMTQKAATAAAMGDDVEIVEPIRAALTWHEDEITVYDPDDEDDDGTGINGIGFKPTPAMAYARLQKRKQQLAEYRKREESDARTRRSQRRRGSPALPPALSAKQQERKVRFMESEQPSTVVTTG